MTKKRVLMTGAAGYVGTVLLDRLATRYDWRLTDLRRPAHARSEPFVTANINDLATLTELCQGVDTVLHLAAQARIETTWADVGPDNLMGPRQVFEAARQAGCRRVIFISSLTVLDGYGAKSRLLSTALPAQPLTLYAASKLWGEALAHSYAQQHGISLLCLRLGWVKAATDNCLHRDWPYLSHVLTEDDCARFIAAGLDAPDALRWGIFHGLSDNRHKFADISTSVEQLGYQPLDDAFALAAGSVSLGERVRRRAGHVWRSLLRPVQ